MYAPLYDVIDGLDTDICELDEIVLKAETMDEYMEEAMIDAIRDMEQENGTL